MVVQIGGGQRCFRMVVSVVAVQNDGGRQWFRSAVVHNSVGRHDL